MSDGDAGGRAGGGASTAGSTLGPPAGGPAGRVDRPSSANRQAAAGWLFTAPALVILGLFLVVPVLMAAWVAVSDWNGRGSPFGPSVGYVGAENFRQVLTSEGGLQARDFGTALRNNFWYVVLVVPLQTAASLTLAVLLNRRVLQGRGFFRTAFYFPSVTSSVAITLVFLFLFSGSGAVNQMLGWVGINGPNWFQDPRGVLHVLLGVVGVDDGPAALTGSTFLSISWWEWLAGPSVAMSALMLMAVFTTSGTFMLLFIAALQNISGEVDEAAMMDGASGWQRFRFVTVPMLRPTLFTVLTLGLIGTWQVFDQIYVGTQGGPGKTTITPAYLSYTSSFTQQNWGQGAAIAFILFFIIVTLAVLQRWILRERTTVPKRKRYVQVGTAGTAATPTATVGGSR